MKKLLIWWHRRRAQYHRAQEADGKSPNKGETFRGALRWQIFGKTPEWHNQWWLYHHYAVERLEQKKSHEEN